MGFWENPCCEEGKEQKLVCPSFFRVDILNGRPQLKGWPLAVLKMLCHPAHNTQEATVSWVSGE